ncbi:hypothetical protein [Turneriella parva]|uniref:Uncharacterized protein n=1 Tax=Turneriella parva (strain ATCC BAA-1111 / DSM 21527 / NCTC 11395 / H) TaxID=869212 RepID=I4B9U0_TURPD|nr:hypothetical protein [Turneriella parva]AFM14047.1 hypothetical protein Turpa_3410 [Turneriella parva DSM 21527]
MKGLAFYGAPNGHAHLYLVISDINPDDGTVLCVNITDSANIPDKSCLLNVGDHPFIKKESAVFYWQAINPELNSITHGIKLGALTQQANLLPATLAKVQDGAKASKFLKPKFHLYFQYF